MDFHQICFVKDGLQEFSRLFRTYSIPLYIDRRQSLRSQVHGFLPWLESPQTLLDAPMMPIGAPVN